LAKEVTGDQHRSPGAGVKDFDRPLLSELCSQWLWMFITLEKAVEQGQDGFQGIASSEVGDDLLLDFVVFAHGADDADVLVDGAIGRRDFDGADEHNAIITSPLLKSR